MKVLYNIVLTLVIIGALNWLLIGIFKFDLVAMIFGEMSVLSRIIYTLVGLSGIVSIGLYSNEKSLFCKVKFTHFVKWYFIFD